jgi:hypothetical protein
MTQGEKRPLPKLTGWCVTSRTGKFPAGRRTGLCNADTLAHRVAFTEWFFLIPCSTRPSFCRCVCHSHPCIQCYFKMMPFPPPQLLVIGQKVTSISLSDPLTQASPQRCHVFLVYLQPTRFSASMDQDLLPPATQSSG